MLSNRIESIESTRLGVCLDEEPSFRKTIRTNRVVSPSPVNIACDAYQLLAVLTKRVEVEVKYRRRTDSVSLMSGF